MTLVSARRLVVIAHREHVQDGQHDDREAQRALEKGNHDELT